MGRKLIDLTGEKFGKLTVIERAENIGSVTMYKCKCECGKALNIQYTNLKNGQVSCGCHMKEVYKSKAFSEANTKHGYYNHELYGAWFAMKRRCTNPKDKSYKNYGGRGIKVCDRWLESPKNYINDIEKTIGKKPTKYHTLDRIDNDGNYEISNVRWADKSEQAVNQRHKTGKLNEKYIFKKRGLYIVSIVRNKERILSNGQKNLDDAIFLRDYYLSVFEKTPEKWTKICNDKKYKDIKGEMLNGK